MRPCCFREALTCFVTPLESNEKDIICLILAFELIYQPTFHSSCSIYFFRLKRENFMAMKKDSLITSFNYKAEQIGSLFLYFLKALVLNIRKTN